MTSHSENRIRSARRQSLLGFVVAGLACVATLQAAPDDTERPALVPPAGQMMAIDPANFDQWVFQGARTAAAARAQIDSRFKLQLALVDRVYQLSDEQKAKLQLAAEGDTARFFDEVEVVRRKFLAAANDQNAIGQIWQHIQPLQMKLAAGLFNDQSLYAKVLAKTLDGEQSKQHREILEERRRYRYRATIEAAVATLDDGVAFNDKQRQTIIQMLVDKTNPPQSFGQQDYFLVLYRLSTLPQDDLSQVLDVRQRKLLAPQLEQGRSMKHNLIQNGIIAANE
jgi:hypothetical protein